MWDISWGYGTYYRDMDRIYHRNMGHITGMWIGIWDISWGCGTYKWDIDRMYHRNMEYITGAISARSFAADSIQRHLVA